MAARTRANPVTKAVIGLMGLLLVPFFTGCTEDDCVTCVQDPPEPPVAPTQVYSTSGDGQITVFWNDFPEFYSDDITSYVIWSRFFEPGDENNPAREFYYIDEVLVGQNYDPSTGQYHYVDTSVDNAIEYEYAVSTVSTHGESYLSFEFVTDTPLPMSETALTLFDVEGPNSHLAGFDFSLAGRSHGRYQGPLRRRRRALAGDHAR